MKTKYTEASVLFVDDETSILSSLNRLFRKIGWNIKLAESGEEALSMINEWQPDVVVSDMRMPGINGATLLTEVEKKYPGTVKILLTGYADLESTVAAINEAHIFSYVAKPWDNDLLFQTIESGLKLRFLEKERDELQKVVNDQNEILRDLNNNLKIKVDRQAQEIDQASLFVDQASEEIQQNFDHVIELLCITQEFLENRLAGHGRKVSLLSKKIGEKCKLSSSELKTLEVAATIHDIGNIGVDRTILQKSYHEMTDEDLQLWKQHSIIGYSLLRKIPALQEVAKIVLHHHERYDGKGFPNKLKGENIPLASRIIHLADYFDELANGSIYGKIPEKPMILKEMRSLSGSNFDPELLDILIDLIKEKSIGFMEEKEKPHSISLNSSELLPGMKLATDLLTPDDVLLYKEGNRLDESTIEKILSLEKTHKRSINIKVALQTSHSQ